jgi:hypothetical protein
MLVIVLPFLRPLRMLLLVLPTYGHPYDACRNNQEWAVAIPICGDVRMVTESKLSRT